MRVWRITRRKYAALDGEGARLNGGRWNTEGVAAVYTSATLSLVALEYLVHVDIDEVPDDLVSLEIEVPDDIAREEVVLDRLPPDWARIDDHPECAAAGNDWVRRGDTLVLQVPSAVIPMELNFLINPRHPDSQRVAVVAQREFRFDARLLT